MPGAKRPGTTRFNLSADSRRRFVQVLRLATHQRFDARGTKLTDIRTIDEASIARVGPALSESAASGTTIFPFIRSGTCTTTGLPHRSSRLLAACRRFWLHAPTSAIANV